MTIMIIMMIIKIKESIYNEIKAKSNKIPKVEKRQNLSFWEKRRKKTFSLINDNYDDFNINSGNYDDFHDNSFIINNSNDNHDNDNNNDNNDKMIILMIVLIFTAIIAIINSILIIFILIMII